MEHYKITSSKSTVDLLMSGPETEPDWKEEDDKLRFSDDELDPKVHYKSVKMAANASTVDLLMTGPEGEESVLSEDELEEGDKDQDIETVLHRRSRSVANQMIECPFCSL